MKLLAETEGIFTETAGGTTIAVLKKLAEAGKINPDETTVAYITGNGLKTQEAVQGYIGEPLTLEPKLDSFERAWQLSRLFRVIEFLFLRKPSSLAPGQISLFASKATEGTLSVPLMRLIRRSTVFVSTENGCKSSYSYPPAKVHQQSSLSELRRRQYCGAVGCPGSKLPRH
jgi:hypothetical protein